MSFHTKVNQSARRNFEFLHKYSLIFLAWLKLYRVKINLFTLISIHIDISILTDYLFPINFRS